MEPYDARPLAGRVALVTGAGQGVGRGIAMRLAAAGAKVAVNDLSPARADAVAAEIRDHGGDALGLAFDVTDAAAAETAVNGLEIDILVNNAGVPPGGGRPNRFAEMPPEDWQLQIDLNLAALMRLTQLVIPGQAKRGWGRIIQISSGASARGLAIGVAAYGAAKAGGESLIRHLGVEYGPAGITANSLALGLMEGVGRAGDPGVDRLINSIPIGRLGRPDDVGEACVWLSSEAGGLANGQVIHLNGGTVFGR
ncbi:SDR family NAD(P)-dependent oxidoreductase [Nocardioides sp. Bht2]|uniref:SDR family NAD(P)-dependent oxidoreductase n=1 Tax=Nocardioides sp. Bht2 TaxID=3392297 RepID=UPI0039B3BF53